MIIAQSLYRTIKERPSVRKGADLQILTVSYRLLNFAVTGTDDICIRSIAVEELDIISALRDLIAGIPDAVYYVTAESARAGKAAAQYALSGEKTGRTVTLLNGDGVTYTVPQRVRISETEKSAGIFFRVNRIMNDSVIHVLSHGEKLLSFRRGHMAPGEMEHIVVPMSVLKKSDGEITVATEVLS